MNKKNLESKEIRLGLIHVAGLLGLTVGCIAAAFCLGYLAGSKVGFERESSTILAELPKFPVNQEGSDDIGEKIASEVYAKLNEPSKEDLTPPSEGGTPVAQENVPDLASIPDISSDTLQQESDEIAANSDSQPEVVAPPTAEQAEVKVLGDLQKGKESSAAESAPENAAIGTLLDKKEPSAVAKVEVLPTAKPEPTVAKKEIEKANVKGGPISVTNKVPAGWYAQVAAPKKPEDAHLLGQNLKKSGFGVTIESAEVRGEAYYRVLVGPESSKNQAQVLIQQLKRESYIKGEPFIRVVK